MRLRLRVTDDRSGEVILAGLVSQMYAASGQDELSDFSLPQLGALEVSRSRAGYAVTLRGRSTVVETYASFECDGVTLHCTILRNRAQAFPRGHCPRCGASLEQRSVGGAYRSVAVQQRRCGVCQAEVLELNDVASLGEPSAIDRGFVRVVAPMACPTCGASMTPGRITAGDATVTVEGCGGCRLVLIEPEDRAALERGAGR